jgi:uncharacterized protein (DUF1330 family)
MPKAYWVTCYRQIKDADKVAAYAKLAGPALAPFGAKPLARGVPAVAHESGMKERIVITEFPSVAQATAAHDGPAYQEALKALGDGAVRDIRIVEGME